MAPKQQKEQGATAEPLPPPSPLAQQQQQLQQQDGSITQEEGRQEVVVDGVRRGVIIVQNYTGTPPVGGRAAGLPHAHSGSGEEGEDGEGVVPGQAPLPSVATLCNSAIGAGMLSLPFAFQKAGVVGGVVLCATIGVAEAFTLYILSKMAERYNANSYSQLVRATLGKKMATFLSLLMAVYMWGACNAYLVIVGDVFSALIASALGPESLFANRRIIILGVGLGLLLPLCFVKRLGALGLLSTTAVLGFLYTSGVILYAGYREAYSRENPWEDVELFKFDMGVLYALPVIVFGFNCHANSVTIFHELTDEPAKTILPIKSRRKTSKLVNMIGVIMTAILLIMTGYLAVGLAGYVAYPHSVTSNIINILPADDLWVQTARAIIGFVVAGHFPLNHHPARAGAVEVALVLGAKESVAENIVAPIFTLVFVCSSVTLSLFVSDLGDILHLIGGTVAALLIFFNPGFMLINAAIVKSSTERLARIETMQRRRAVAALRGEYGPQVMMHEKSLDEAQVPLLEEAAVKGIKTTGLVYSPGKSWAAGLLLVAFAVFIMVTTVVTTFVN